MTDEVGSMGKDSLERFADSFAHIVDHCQGVAEKAFYLLQKGDDRFGLLGSDFDIFEDHAAESIQSAEQDRSVAFASAVNM